MTVVIGILEQSASSKLSSDGGLVKTYRHVYLHRSDSDTRPTFAEIDSDIGIAPGSPYGDDLNATAGSAVIDIRKARPPFCAAEVTVEWSTANPVPSETATTDPTTNRILWEIRTNAQSIYIIRDRDGELITNSAKTPYDGGIPTTERIGVAIAKVNVPDASFDYQSVVRDSGAVNSVEYLGAEPGTLQVDIDARENYSGSGHWWEVTYTFSYRHDGWQPTVPDAGFYQLGALGVPVPITYGDLASPPTDDSTRVPEPEPLSGGVIVPIASRPDGCAVLTFNHFPEIDFADFNLF